MNLDDIKQILDMVRQHELAEFELEQEGVKLRVRKNGAMPQLATTFTAPVVLPATPPAGVALAGGAVVPGAPTLSPADAVDAASEEAIELAVVTSPIVGTFYRSSDPASPPFVEPGQVVRKGQVLCIIEAMKLMNEIESEYEGEIVKIYADNAQPVQYGERLFAIRVR